MSAQSNCGKGSIAYRGESGDKVAYCRVPGTSFSYKRRHFIEETGVYQISNYKYGIPRIDNDA